MMKILGLMAYPYGYRGFLEEDDQYIYFRASGKQIRKLQTYDKTSFVDYDHFIGLMSRFIPATAFYKKPVAVSALSMAELDRIFRRTGAIHES